mgnify:FL=1|tara:strand:- start:125 stop:688 length:564 start_codon:yes stop_codon:yes gene_type:complete
MKLTIAQRTEIVRLYLSGLKQREIAEQFGVSISTVSKQVKKMRAGELPNPMEPSPVEGRDRSSPPPGPPAQQLEAASLDALDPVRFRRVKLAEIDQDIGTARKLGRVTALPGLHRLHIEVHDQAVACIEERGDDVSGLSQAEQERVIFSELSRLPPSMRHRLLDHLEALDAGKVVALPSGTAKRSEG